VKLSPADWLLASTRNKGGRARAKSKPRQNVSSKVSNRGESRVCANFSDVVQLRVDPAISTLLRLLSLRADGPFVYFSFSSCACYVHRRTRLTGTARSRPGTQVQPRPTEAVVPDAAVRQLLGPLGHAQHRVLPPKRQHPLPCGQCRTLTRTCPTQ